MITACRNIVSATTRLLPNIKGVGKASELLNGLFLKLNCDPIAIAPMKLGHSMIVDTRTLTETRSFYTGDYDGAKIGFFIALMDEGSVFLDIGANVGFYTVPIARAARQKHGKVISFEPLPSNFQRLHENIQLNHLDEMVRLIPVGLSSSFGQATITLREDFLQGGKTGNAAILIEDGADEKFPAQQIQLETLDDLRGGKIERVDLIKIDVEGHEDQVLKDARNTIERQRPIIMIEIGGDYFRRRGVDLYNEIRSVLPAGYRAYLPVPASSIMSDDRFSSLRETTSFETGQTDNAFLVPDEKRHMVARVTSLH
jgi:FkbM family methyltransferase